MSVDMFESRFRTELRKLPLFTAHGVRNQQVWDKDFSAWRALFTSALLWGHSTGYKLPSYDYFFALCKKAYTHDHPKREEYKPFFEEPLLEGMKERVSVWYESGMSETYVYVCLAEVLEDKLKSGMVSYDPRHDWKLKCDTAVILNDHLVRISTFYGSLGDRTQVEARRDKIERVRKVNTSQSAHWGNKQVKSFTEFQICRDDIDCQVVNGVHLFSIEAINDLLEALFEFAQISDDDRQYFLSQKGRTSIGKREQTT